MKSKNAPISSTWLIPLETHDTMATSEQVKDESDIARFSDLPLPTGLPSDDAPTETGVNNWVLFTINNVIITLTLLGNMMTLFIIIRYKKLQTVTNSFVISLSCAGLLMGCIYPVYNVLNYTTLTGDVQDLHIPCSLSLYFIVVSAGVSNLSLMAVTTDRYIAVTQPLRYHVKVTKRRGNMSIVAIWVYITLASLSIFAVYGRGARYYTATCSLLNLIPEWYFFGIILPHMLIPNVISKVLYGRIVCVANQLETEAYDLNIALGKTKAKREYRAAKLMALIMVLFILCWAPYTLCHVVIHVIGTDSPDWLYTVLEISKVFIVTSACVNPVIYTWKSPGFRRALRLCWGCKEWKKADTVVIPDKVDRSTSVTSVTSHT